MTGAWTSNYLIELSRRLGGAGLKKGGTYGHSADSSVFRNARLDIWV